MYYILCQAYGGAPIKNYCTPQLVLRTDSLSCKQMYVIDGYMVGFVGIPLGVMAHNNYSYM